MGKPEYCEPMEVGGERCGLVNITIAYCKRQ